MFYNISFYFESSINKSITPEIRQSYMEMLAQKCLKSRVDFTEQSSLFPSKNPDYSAENNHEDALDIFIPEGTDIHAVRGGIVVSAEGGWQKGQEFSTASYKGGNYVIIFNPAEKSFFRYCHLESIAPAVKIGTVVPCGTVLGKVGHTGKNAAKPGHGNHLHLEVNRFQGNKIEYCNAQTIINLLEQKLASR